MVTWFSAWAMQNLLHRVSPDAQTIGAVKKRHTFPEQNVGNRLLGQRLQRLDVAKLGPRPAAGRRPAHGVGNHPAYAGVKVGGVGFVAGAEVENLAPAASIAAAAAENLAAGEPADEDQGLERRDVEALAIHLLALDDQRFAQPSRNRVAGFDHPQPLVLVGLAPLQFAGGAHQPPEDPRIVGGMQHDQAHAVEHALVDAPDDVVADLVVRQVAPPGEHIGLGQYTCAEPLLWIVERGSAHAGQAVLAQAVGNGRVQAAWVDGGDMRVLPLVAALVPDGDANFWLHSCLSW